MKLQHNLHWLIYALFILGCARQTTPTGGPKDTISPVLIKSIPRKEEVNFKAKEIELAFSESIILNNPKEQILITPDAGKDYETKLKGTKVILQFNKPLKDSTTYLINFRDAVQDITEKNPAKNLKLAFSTGSYIDSLSITGRITDALKAKEIKDATVALYAQDTFNIFKHKPIYLTKADAKGLFKIENLKPGQYFIYAFDDKNKNLVVDSRNESFGFISDSIALTQNVKGTVIPTVRLDTRPLKLTSARPYNTYFNIKTTKSLASYKISGLEPTEIVVSSYGEDNANIRVYNTLADKDSIAIRLQALDSIDNRIDTTLYAKFIKREIEKEKFEVKTESIRLLADKGTLKGIIKMNKPLLEINTDSIHYIIDSTRNIAFLKEDFVIDTSNNTVYFNKTFDPKILQSPEVKNPANPDSSKLQPRSLKDKQSQVGKAKPEVKKKADQKETLYLGSCSFVSIELDSSKTISEKTKPKKAEELGIIFIEINTEAKNIIVQLLDKNFKIIETVKNNKRFSFDGIDPGEYQVRLIIDINNDGQWTPGNFSEKEEPEPIIFYMTEKKTQSVSLKANWEVGPLLITY